MHPEGAYRLLGGYVGEVRFFERSAGREIRVY